jgi:hypothetical protein
MVAAATQPNDQEFDDHVTLLDVVEKLGVHVTIDQALCKQQQNWYGGYALDGSELALCSRGNRTERLDTIRHESWHVLQDLKDCSVTDKGMIRVAMGPTATPSEYKGIAAKAYEPKHVPTEAEAIWAADTFSALTIANLIFQQASECGFRFAKY